MLFTKVACAAALGSVVHAANSARAAAAANGGSGTSLSANAIQSGSFVDGSTQVGGAELGQAKSLTSQNNFINNCAGKTLTNGLQITTGSCNGITMGDIPAKTAMVSSTIIFPPTQAQAAVASDTDFNITVQMSNLIAGSFTNADASYYAAPQFLQGGVIVGHTHVTVQDLGGSLNPSAAPDPTKFAFFKGINDAGNGKGLLTAVVTGGLPAGNYRVCTIASASNHQPVLMPVAQRGTADDCTKFTVSGSGTTANIAANDGSKGVAAAALAASAVQAGPGAVDTNTAVAAAAASSTSTAAAKGGKAAATSSAAASSTSAAAAKGGKAAATSSAAASSTSAAAASSTSAAAAKGGKAAATSSAAASSTSAAAAKGGKAAATSSAAASSTSAAASKGGKATGAKAGARRARQFIS